MSRRGRVLTWVALTVIPCGLMRVAAQQTVFRAATDAVVIDVAVRRGSTPALDLQAGDFEVRDRGVRQAVSVRRVEGTPLDISLLLDLSGSVEGPPLDRLKRGVRELERRLRPHERMRVIAMRHVLEEVIPMQYGGGGAAAVEGLRAFGGTALYDGLVAAMLRVPAPDHRQIVVACTDGGDTSSILDAAAALEIARVADAVVYIVTPAGSPARPPASLAPSGSPAAILSTLTDRTGGDVFALTASDSVGDAFGRALDSHRQRYIVTYTPRGVERAGWHDLQVRITAPGTYDVRTRQGYEGGGR